MSNEQQMHDDSPGLIEAITGIRIPTRILYVVSWLIVAAMLAYGIYVSWHHFDTSERCDGNSGHREIDFGGQWLMGRMIVEGHGKKLYRRDIHRKVLGKAYPLSDRSPDAQTSDTDDLLGWMIELKREEGEPELGGPLYPPVHAFYYAPLGMVTPRTGYRLMQLFCLFSMVFCGLAVSMLSRGVIWWPVASMILLVYPGLGGAVNLGQNATLSLVILFWGWVALDRGHPVLAGIIWGFFAFKPVWAVTFCLVPLLTRRWSMLITMIVTGTTLALLTVPFVGIESWLHWLRIGREASSIYNVDQNWIDMSRDLLGLARRWELDFTQSDKELHAQWLRPTLHGWMMLLLIFEVTARLVWLRPEEMRSATGKGSAFLLLAVWFACYHFMYYDVLLTALPVFLILIGLTQSLRSRFIFNEREVARPFGWWSIIGTLLITLLIGLNHLEWYLFHYVGINRMMIPFDQFALLALWIWCAITWTWDQRAPLRLEQEELAQEECDDEPLQRGIQPN